MKIIDSIQKLLRIKQPGVSHRTGLEISTSQRSTGSTSQVRTEAQAVQYSTQSQTKLIEKPVHTTVKTVEKSVRRVVNPAIEPVIEKTQDDSSNTNVIPVSKEITYSKEGFVQKTIEKQKPLHPKVAQPAVVIEPFIEKPVEKLTMENMSPETKKMLTEFLMCPTRDYMGLANLLSTYDTEAKLRIYLSSRIGVRKARSRIFYD